MVRAGRVCQGQFARFYDPSYHRNRERHLSVSLVKKSDKVNGA